MVKEHGTAIYIGFHPPSQPNIYIYFGFHGLPQVPPLFSTFSRGEGGAYNKTVKSRPPLLHVAPRADAGKIPYYAGKRQFLAIVK